MSSSVDERVPIVEIPEITISKHRIIIPSNYHRPQYDILPEKPEELDKEIDVGGGATVGRIFGTRVEIGKSKASRVTQVASAVGIERIIVQGGAHINGPLVSRGKISVGPNSFVSGDIVGQEVFVQDKCLIRGNILSDKDVTISNGSRIYGIVYSQSGGVAVGRNCLIFDIIAQGNIVVGKTSILLDSTIWSTHGKLEAKNIKMASMIDPTMADPNVEDVYHLADGIESTTVNEMKTADGTELNAGWLTAEDELSRRNALIDLLKTQWAELYNISWEFIE